jgi:FkbM family methyltransferase
MAGNRLQRAALWMYRQADQSGLLAVPPVRRAYELAYRRYKRHFEDPFYHLARRHPELFAGGHILDVGANIGYTAEIFSGVIDRGWRVFAFEPSSAHVQRLLSSIDRRGLRHIVTVRHVAVSDHAGTTYLVLNPDNPADHRLPALEPLPDAASAREPITVTTIDDEVRDAGIAPIAFIKIDVQGCELKVCRGMTDTLRDNPAASVAVEFSPPLIRTYGDDPGGLPQFFWERGYTAYRLARAGALTVMASRDFGEVPAPDGYVDVLFTRVPPGNGR